MINNSVAVDEFDILACPKCGEGYLHQDTVGVYHKRRNAEQEEQSVIVSNREGVCVTDVPRAWSLNPSGRRDGIRIGFWCEHECAVPDLLIYQTKGNTYIRWDTERKLPPGHEEINEW